MLCRYRQLERRCMSSVDPHWPSPQASNLYGVHGVFFQRAGRACICLSRRIQVISSFSTFVGAELIECTLFEGSNPLVASINYLPKSVKAGFQLGGFASASPPIAEYLHFANCESRRGRSTRFLPCRIEVHDSVATCGAFLGTKDVGFVFLILLPPCSSFILEDALHQHRKPRSFRWHRFCCLRCCHPSGRRKAGHLCIQSQGSRCFCCRVQESPMGSSRCCRWLCDDHVIHLLSQPESALTCLPSIADGTCPIPVATTGAGTYEFAVETRQVFSHLTGEFIDFPENGTTLINTNVTLGVRNNVPIPFTFLGHVYMDYNEDCRIYQARAFAQVPIEVLGLAFSTAGIPPLPSQVCGALPVKEKRFDA